MQIVKTNCGGQSCSGFCYLHPPCSYAAKAVLKQQYSAAPFSGSKTTAGTVAKCKIAKHRATLYALATCAAASKYLLHFVHFAEYQCGLTKATACYTGAYALSTRWKRLQSCHERGVHCSQLVVARSSLFPQDLRGLPLLLPALFSGALCPLGPKHTSQTSNHSHS